MKKSKLAVLAAGGAGAAAAAGIGAVKGWKWLQATARETDLWIENGNPYPNSYYYQEGDYTLHYQVDFPAPGTPYAGKMFLIHGFACNSRFWDEMVEIFLKQGFICVRPDIPNCGLSTRETYTVAPIPREQLLMNLLATVDASDAIPDGKWILLGHSLGGGISLNLAAEYKDWFSAVMLYAPMVPVDVPGFVKNIVTMEPMCNFMDKMFGPLCSHDAVIRAILLLMTIDVRYSMLFETYKFADGLTVPKTGTGMCYMMARGKPTDPAEVATIDIPIKLFWANIDLFNLPSVTKKFQAMLPNPDVTRIRIAGHCLVQNCAPEVCEESLAFLRRNGIIV